MSALLLYSTIVLAGLLLASLIATSARHELDAASVAWTKAPPRAQALLSPGRLLAFAAARCAEAPRGMLAVVGSYCETAGDALGASLRAARLAHALGATSSPLHSWQNLRLAMRLRLMPKRIARLMRNGRPEQLACLTAAMLKLDADVRRHLDEAPQLPRREGERG